MTTRSTSEPRKRDGTLNPHRSIRLWRWAFGVVLAVQLIVLYAPDVAGGPGVKGLDKVIHALIFAAPALAALMVGIRVKWALGILAAHAPVSELIQHLVLPHREGDVLDVMADLGGVLLGGLAYLVWNRRHH